VPELALPAGLVEPPVTLVAGAVRPDLDPVAVFHVAEPLTFVDCTVFEDHFTFVLKLTVWIIAMLGTPFVDFS
jgi:hypothetical protein